MARYVGVWNANINPSKLFSQVELTTISNIQKNHT